LHPVESVKVCEDDLLAGVLVDLLVGLLSNHTLGANHHGSLEAGVLDCGVGVERHEGLFKFDQVFFTEQFCRDLLLSLSFVYKLVYHVHVLVVCVLALVKHVSCLALGDSSIKAGFFFHDHWWDLA
jgi:hypothetical protein